MSRCITVVSAFLLSTASFYAVSLPLTPLDSRSIGMGGTGVAAARTAQAARFNPALLSFADDDEDFSLILPQFGFSAADEQELFDSITDFVDADYVDLFETSIDSIRASVSSVTDDAPAIESAASSRDIAALQTAVDSLDTVVTALNSETITVDQNTNALIVSLDSLSNKSVRGKLGGNFAMAFPSQDFGMAFTINAELDFSGVLMITQNDLDLLDVYSDAATAYSAGLVDYSTAASDLLTATTNLNDAINNGDPPATIATLQAAADSALTAFDNAEAALENFNYGGTATPADPNDGNKVIFSNGELAGDADDVDLTSSGHFIAVTTTEFGWSLSKSFRVGDQALAIGITPKLQQFELYDYFYQVEDDEDIDFDDVLDAKVSEDAFNIDIGVVQSFGSESQWRVGLVARNLIKQEFQTALGADVEISPQFRAGLAYNWGWLTLAADYDLTENDAVAFGSTTQYAMFGAEMDVFEVMQLRLGYRSDTANSGFDSYSVGLGFSPFGVHLDVSGFVNTTNADNEAGVAVEFGIEW